MVQGKHRACNNIREGSNTNKRSETKVWKITTKKGRTAKHIDEMIL